MANSMNILKKIQICLLSRFLYLISSRNLGPSIVCFTCLESGSLESLFHMPEIYIFHILFTANLHFTSFRWTQSITTIFGNSLGNLLGRHVGLIYIYFSKLIGAICAVSIATKSNNDHQRTHKWYFMVVLVYGISLVIIFCDIIACWCHYCERLACLISKIDLSLLSFIVCSLKLFFFFLKSIYCYGTVNIYWGFGTDEF